MSSDNDLSSSRLYEEAYDLMLNEQYDKALEVYSLAIEKSDKSDMPSLYNYYIGRSEANLKLNKYQEAISDAQEAINLNKNDSRAYLRKGKALFNLKEFKNALESLEEGLKLEGQNQTKLSGLFDDFINKCKKELPPPVVEETKPTTTTANNEPTPQPASAPAPIPPPVPTIKHEWYQTESTVTVSILAKNLKAEELKIETTDQSLTVQSNDQEKLKIDFKFNLSNKIAPNDTQIKFLSTKVEIKLKKNEASHWSALELTAAQLAAKNKAEMKPSYPTSSKNPRNWDKIVAEVTAEEKDEKLEGDAALNRLFQQVYSNGSDETRRAMNKSFSESGGTVLSTNWKEIGAQKVEIKAPDGMEWKKWDS